MEKWLLWDDPDIRWIMKENLKKNRLIRLDPYWTEQWSQKLGHRKDRGFINKCAAFFDVDGTISREGLISEMFRKMIKYELIDISKWHKEVEPAFTRWNRRVGDYDL